MIRFLANFFRGLSYIVGMTAPPPGQNEKSFVFLWLGVIAFLIIAAPVIFYVVLKLTLR